ncbi:uncharacterized protein JN550_010461 [Neoarthrinium moseri]|uniref:uncharacterized protein n=1 Tax=Neoarthrinium moseri TaxID=1658444 RepID=UPI001FDE9700|nr:uncharacterized protein JN550_010461 [Neoarthrinium moseri]KAI1862158.1 hypothetical protein JN550_010461 [Neoarthrinium moseri]
MAPTTILNELSKRYTCSTYDYNRGNCYSAWDWYGRWILFGVIVVVAIIIFFLWACVNSRRRRRRGMQPMYGTGWMASNNGQYQNNPQAYHAAPPAYGAPGQSYPMQPQYTGQTFNQADGYYGQREGVAQPKPAHTVPDYAPPEGPPPPKTTH